MLFLQGFLVLGVKAVQNIKKCTGLLHLMPHFKCIIAVDSVCVCNDPVLQVDCHETI